MDNKNDFRDNLLVTAGVRAAYMECSRMIDLPAGSVGEDALAGFVTEAVDKYIEEPIDIPFDEYIESALMDEYRKEKEDEHEKR